RYADALRSREKARDIASRLSADHPDRAETQYLLAHCHADAAVALRQLGRPTEALDEFRLCLSLLARLVAANPAVGDYQKFLAETYKNVAGSLSRLGRNAEALDSFATARRYLEPLVAGQPALTWPRYILAKLELENAYSLFLTGAPLDEVIRHP